jgi:hypothetical protein
MHEIKFCILQSRQGTVVCGVNISSTEATLLFAPHIQSWWCLCSLLPDILGCGTETEGRGSMSTTTRGVWARKDEDDGPGRRGGRGQWAARRKFSWWSDRRVPYNNPWCDALHLSIIQVFMHSCIHVSRPATANQNEEPQEETDERKNGPNLKSLPVKAKPL